jgi:transmembrane sensor
MKDFRLFDIYDFLMDEDFIRWVKEHRKEDNDFWQSWLSQHPDKHIIIAEATRILETLRPGEIAINDSEKEMEVSKLLFTIGKQPFREQEVPVIPVAGTKKWWYAAAVFFIVLAGTVSYFLLKTHTPTEKFDYASVTPSKRLVENVNTSGKPVKLRLPDESVVELAPNSRIAYPNNFDSSDTRDVYLLGEALFTVTKNPSRPFRVFANEIVTKVLGTSFMVRSFDLDSTIQVVVKTGKVSVFSQVTVREAPASNSNGGIILSPNQGLVYQRAKQKFQRVLLDNPAMIVPLIADKNLNYADEPLEKVFEQLGRNYGIMIVFDAELLKNCTINADLRNIPFYEKIELICKAIEAHYEIIDGQVVIHTNGCEQL